MTVNTLFVRALWSHKKDSGTHFGTAERSIQLKGVQ